MNRGDRREPIFRDEGDRELFLETMGESCRKTVWQEHALCPMANHFHLVVGTPRASVVGGMKWFLGTSCTAGKRLKRNDMQISRTDPFQAA